jgi:hypothetical protein
MSHRAVARQSGSEGMLPHSGMLPSRVIVASFKRSSTFPSAEPRFAGSNAISPSTCRECIAPSTMVCAISLRQFYRPQVRYVGFVVLDRELPERYCPTR